MISDIINFLNGLEKITPSVGAIMALFGASLVIIGFLGYLPAAAVNVGAIPIGLLGCVTLVVHGAAGLSALLQRKRAESREEQREVDRRLAVLRSLNTIGEEGLRVLNHFVAATQQRFEAPIDQRELATLVEAGLVERAEGAFHILRWPHTIPDFVWDELQRRQRENPQRRGR